VIEGAIDDVVVKGPEKDLRVARMMLALIPNSPSAAASTPSSF
jgi:hypothetical protein